MDERLSDSEKRSCIEAEIDKRQKLENLCKKQREEIEKEKNISAFKKAWGFFSWPFDGEKISSLIEFIPAVIATVLFAGASVLLGFAALFCAIVDLVWLLIFCVLYPFILLYCAIFKAPRIKRMEKKLKETETELKELPSLDALKNELKLYSNGSSSSSSYLLSSDSPCVSDDVKNTDWYKQKKDEYFRFYMGYPPKEEHLSDLATDTTLDLHPGDY